MTLSMYCLCPAICIYNYLSKCQTIVSGAFRESICLAKQKNVIMCMQVGGPETRQELSLSSAPCQTESEGTILLQLLEFKTHLLEAVEELHIRRV